MSWHQVAVSLFRIQRIEQKGIVVPVGSENHRRVDQMDVGLEEYEKRRLFPDHRPEKSFSDNQGVLPMAAAQKKSGNAPLFRHESPVSPLYRRLPVVPAMIISSLDPFGTFGRRIRTRGSISSDREVVRERLTASHGTSSASVVVAIPKTHRL